MVLDLDFEWIENHQDLKTLRDLMVVSLDAATTTMLVKNAIYHDYW